MGAWPDRVRIMLNYAKLCLLIWVGTRRIVESIGNYVELHGDKRRERWILMTLVKKPLSTGMAPTGLGEKHLIEYLVRGGDTSSH